MTYTSKCDIYVAVYEHGINGLIARLMTEIPSFFNYGSTYVARYPRSACNPIAASQIDSEDSLISPTGVSGILSLSMATTVNPFPAEDPDIGTAVPFNLNIPIPYVGVGINSSEVVVEADVGP